MKLRTSWRRHAACNAEDADLFFADVSSSEEIQAIAVCEACPVRMACLIEALADEGGRKKEGRYGIRAGLTPGQRYYLVTKHARKETAA